MEDNRKIRSCDFYVLRNTTVKYNFKKSEKIHIFSILRKYRHLNYILYQKFFLSRKNSKKLQKLKVFKSP
ncbi:MAG: hypothetical protein D6805_01565 [Planctomycetota bacterium]|nr:MAG: hypothetical protein D6805_01565 [Planctomycetota bacterium]